MSTAFSSKDVGHMEKFDGSNFPFWKFQICLILEQHDLMDIVIGRQTLPDPDISTVNGEDIIRNTADIKLWKQKDNAARCYIVATIEQHWQRSLINCKSSNEMWLRLTSQHEQAAVENKHMVQQRFFEYPYQQGSDVMSHITAIETIANQLSDLGAPVTESQIITKIICTLPPSFRHVISSWDNLDEDKKTLQLLTVRLLKEESLNKSYGDGAEADAAFFIKRSKPSEPNHSSEKTQTKRKSTRKIKCNFCGLKNHTEDRCWAKAKANAGENAQVAASQVWSEDYAFSSFSYFSKKQFKESTDCWFADSGATQHMSDQFWMFSNYQPFKGNWPVRGIGTDRKPLQVKGHGDISIQTKANGKWNDGIIKDVLFVPKLGANLFSIKSATKRGFTVIFQGDTVKISKGEKIVMNGISSSTNLYRLDVHPISKKSSDMPSISSMSLLGKAQSLSVWHKRLGHIAVSTITTMANSNMADGLNIKNIPNQVHFCEGCILGKSHRAPFPTEGRRRATRIGELIHSDLCGPMSSPSPSGARYFAIFKDDFSSFCTVFFLKKKSEVFPSFQQFAARIATETGSSVITLRSDNGGEYMNSQFSDWLKGRGIQHQSSTSRTPQQNGVSERMNRTIVESARSMLHSAGQPIELWAEATNFAVYLLNRTATKTVDGKTPYEVWKGVKPNLAHTRVFGCEAFVHIPKEHRGKFDAKSVKCRFVGYCEHQKAYRMWNPVTRKVLISRDVIFNEDVSVSESKSDFIDLSSPCLSTNEESSEENESSEEIESSEENKSSEETEWSEETESSEATESSQESSHPVGVINENVSSTAPLNFLAPGTTGKRQRRPPIRWIEESTKEKYAGVAEAVTDDLEEPNTYEEAVASSHAKEWIAAMEEEMESLLSNNTWTLCPLPPGREAIRNRWVFKIKRGSNSEILRFKARLVAKGFTQRAGIDYEETFSPVVKHDSLRTVLAIAARMDLEMLQLDVKTAFLNGELKEELYMDQPTGFASKGEEKLVCSLNKILYGLKQASRTWNTKFHSFLVEYGFLQSTADPCVYVLREQAVFSIMCIWVDDGIVCSSSKSKLDNIVAFLGQKFEMTSGPVDCFVGIQIVRDRLRKSIHLSQQIYIQKLLVRFGLEDCNPKVTPADPFSRLSKDVGQPFEEADKFAVHYREAVGSLIFAVTCTRPDIAFAVSQVSQFSSNPNQAHWEAVKRILSYLKGTAKHGVCFGGVPAGDSLVGYTDADFAASIDDRRSTSGVILIFNGGPVAWTSHRQKCTSLSTTESEFVASAAGAKEISWMRRLLAELGLEQSTPTPLYCDNQSAIRLIKNPEFHQRTKHIDVKFHFVRRLQEDGVVDATYVNTEVQLADLLTKPLDGPRFRRLRNEINVTPV